MDYKNVTILPSSGKKPAGKQSDVLSPEKTTGPSASSAGTVRNPTLHSTPLLSAEELSNTSELSAVMQPRTGDKYRYRKMIGRGGMKLVLQVYDNDTMRDVAMALLPDISTRSKLELGKFLREARITASLEHPNIVPVHDIGLDSAGSPYFTMKLLKGETLGTVLQKLDEGDETYLERYTLKNLMHIYIRICNAIAFAHSKGIVHLDLKPENVQLGDYGEVLVLDWGLARKIQVRKHGTAPAKAPAKTQKIRKQGASEAAAEQADGTPGYMAPEQISGSRYSSSFRTDIYALGALLYTMITYKNPLHSTRLDDMLRDTLQGNIQRPSERASDKEIPFGIEAVVLKAMSLNPDERYSSVDELRSEVNSFINGFDTKAEKASVLKKSLLFVKRHKRAFISGSLILILVLQLLMVYMREAKRRVSVWRNVFTADFLQPGYPVDLIHFKDHNFKDDPQGWKGAVLDKGLALKKGIWLNLKEQFSGNIKISCALEIPKDAKGELELILRDPEKDRTLYVFYLDKQDPGEVQILCADNFYAPRILIEDKVGNPWGKQSFFQYKLSSFRKVSSPSHSKKILLHAEFREDTLVFQIDRETVLSIRSALIVKPNQITFALRSGMDGVKLSGIKIHRLVPPEHTLPLFLGDALLQEKLYDKTIRSYMQIEENRRGTKVAGEALIKAYQVAARYLPDEERSKITLEIKKLLAAFYPDFDQAVLLEEDVCIAWKNKDYALAAVLLEKAFEHDPDTSVMEKILALPHERLTPDVGDLLLRMIRKSRRITSVDLSNYGLRSLQALAGMELISVNCAGNKLRTLKGLSGRKLRSLNCAGNDLRTLDGISLQALHYLDCSGNRISNFSFLTRSPLLKRLKTTGNRTQVTEEMLRGLKSLRFKKL